ncbi:MAG: enoyl-CoA hydratase/isomerase family protein [Caulobacteraceae bacterium]|nr:enoyl-CoA hydratase/isomerase family protein [Caulobacteraceae bacterium]
MPNPIADPFVEVPDTDAQSDLVLIEATPEGAVTVTMNRPDKKNAFNAELIGALRENFETLRDQETLRVVFVRGAGGAFSAGADLEWMREAADQTEGDNRDDALQLAVMLKHLYDIPALTVALVEGPAYGGGAGIVAACDMAIATADARFAFSEVKLGLIPATVSPYVVAAIGTRMTRRLFASGEGFDAEFARGIGLVDQVVADTAGLEGARAKLVADVLACAPLAMGEAKKLVDEVAWRPVDHALMSHTAHRLAAQRTSAEGQEGVRAFLERRKPSWSD